MFFFKLRLIVQVIYHYKTESVLILNALVVPLAAIMVIAIVKVQDVNAIQALVDLTALLISQVGNFFLISNFFAEHFFQSGLGQSMKVT